MAPDLQERGVSDRQMTFRIDLVSEGPPKVFRLSGGIRSAELETFRTAIADQPARTVLDLRDLTLVDEEAVRLLASCERDGMRLLHGSPYLRDRILREGKKR